MEVNQDRIISFAAGFQYAKILLTANELGIFRLVAKGSMSSDDVAKTLRLDPEATAMLMGALVGLGLMSRRAGKFKNAPDVVKYLTDEAEPGEGMYCIATHMNHMYDSWNRLGDIVKKGRPKKLPPPKVILDKKKNREFICGMFEIGFGTAKLLAEKLDLKGVGKMADIGGGPAQFPIAFAAKNPDTKFVVADYPNTLNVAREYVKKYGLADRIKLAKCEFFGPGELGIGDGYDMALLSQVLHAESDKKAVELIAKTYRILKPGGRIVINENARNKDGMSPPPPMIFAINMLVNNFGRTFRVDELEGWLKEAGFKGVKTMRLHERAVVVEGRKP
jgi:ubiquinone/menaquinone biosynthesis C-methylase UbiE